MSWEEYIERLPCPCGNGEYEVLHREDDWFQHEVHYKMFALNVKKCMNMLKVANGIRKECKAIEDGY